MFVKFEKLWKFLPGLKHFVLLSVLVPSVVSPDGHGVQLYAVKLSLYSPLGQTLHALSKVYFPVDFA